MGRIMGLDIGRKRTGVAVTDPLGLIAQPLSTEATHRLVEFIRDYRFGEPVDLLVVGKPLTLRGAPSEAMRYIVPVVKALRRSFPDIPIEEYDERFTSSLAHRALLDGGVGRQDRRDKALVDRVSASLILQSYLAYRSFEKERG